MTSSIEGFETRLWQFMQEHDPEWDQSDLARAAKLDQGTISKILNGRTANPGIDALQKIARALDLTVSELIGEVPPPAKPLPDPVTYFQRYYDVSAETARIMQNLIQVLVESGNRLHRGKAS